MTGYKTSDLGDSDLLSEVMAWGFPDQSPLSSFVPTDPQVCPRDPESDSTEPDLRSDLEDDQSPPLPTTSDTVAKLEKVMDNLVDSKVSLYKSLKSISTALSRLSQDAPPWTDDQVSLFFDQITKIIDGNPLPIKESAVECLSLAFANPQMPHFTVSVQTRPMIERVLDFFRTRDDHLDSSLLYCVSLGGTWIHETQDPDLAAEIMDSLWDPFSTYIAETATEDVLPAAWWFIADWLRCAAVPDDHPVFTLLSDGILGEFEDPTHVGWMSLSVELISVVSIACSLNEGFRDALCDSQFPTALYSAAIPFDGKDLMEVAFPLFCATIGSNLHLEWISPEWVRNICKVCPQFHSQLWDLLMAGVHDSGMDAAQFKWHSYFPAREDSRGLWFFFADMALGLVAEGLCTLLPDCDAFFHLLCDCFDPAGDDDRLAEAVLRVLNWYAENGTPKVIEVIRCSMEDSQLNDFATSRHPEDPYGLLARRLLSLISE
jgi:hypothetical protein